MNDPQRIDDPTGARYDLPKDPYDVTSTDIVQAQTIRRLNRELNQEERSRREAWRAAIMVILCVGAILGGFILCKMMGWGEP